MTADTWAVVRGGEARWVAGSGDGLREAVLVGLDQAAMHLESALVELEPGGSIAGHLHPFEESFYVLAGEALVTIGDRSYRAGTDDWGYVPVATPHTWANPGGEPARWLRTRSPRPRPLGSARGTYPVDGLPLPRQGLEIGPSDRGRRFVGHFEEALLPRPGPLQMKGFRSSGATNVGLSMLVDEAVGAVHHTLFVVEFAPTGPELTLDGQHFHPFEETYYIVAGEAVARLEDESVSVGPGDAVFAGVGVLHGFTNAGDRPVRWIEAQAPTPPPAGALFFAADWTT